jgi:hypothetical protein
MPLVTAGSGVAIGLPANFGLAPSLQASALPPATGLQAVVSGSCSLATNRQVAHFIAAGRPAFAVDPLRLAAGDDVAAEALAWAAPLLAGGPVLVYSTADPGAVKSVQAQLGVEAAGAMVERYARRDRARAGRTWRAPAGRGRRRNLGAPACRRWASRRCRSARRSTPACRGVMPSLGGPGRAPDPEVRQLRHRRLFFQSLYAAPMNEAQARDEICRVGKSLFDRGYVHATAGNISVRLPTAAS